MTWKGAFFAQPRPSGKPLFSEEGSAVVQIHQFSWLKTTDHARRTVRRLP